MSRRAGPQAPGDLPLVSVVVLTRERVESLRRCVESILESSYPRLEVVILDNGDAASRERVAAWLRRLGTRVPLRHLEAPPAGFAELRRAAMAEARGEILMSIDDDCVAAREAISRIVARFAEDPAIGIVGGRIENVGFLGQDRFKGRGRLGVNGRYEVVEDPARAEIFGSANHSLRRAAYEAAGGFDPFFSAGLEEADLALAVRERGYRIVFDPGVEITHYHSESRFRPPRQNLHRMRLYLYFKHFMPRGFCAWAGFARRELGLLGADLAGLRPGPRVRALRAGSASGAILPRVVLHGAFDLYKIVAARLAIPRLVLLARQARGRLRAPGGGQPIESA